MDIIDNLKTFIAVVEAGNFTNAARHLKVAVSLVKKRIDHLESQVGVVLFEMLTGQLPFDGDSAASVLARVLSEEPPAPRSIDPT